MKSGIEHIVSAVPVLRSQYEDEEHHNLTHGNAFPASPAERQLFYRDDDHKWYQYDGTAWRAKATENYVDTEVATAVSAHAALTAGVHGAAAGQDILVAAITRSNFMMIPTAVGWDETIVGAGVVDQEPFRQRAKITDVNAGSALAYTRSQGFNIGGTYGKVNWDKHLYFILNYGIYFSEANLNRRVQLKGVDTLGQLAEMGIGFQVVDLVMTGEAYGIARGTVALGNMIEIADPSYESIQVVIELDPATPAVRFYINGSLIGSIINADHIPSGESGGAVWFAHSIDRAAGGAVNVASVFMHSKIWQEL